ncbi:MAG: hypothetical protein DBY04_01960 [Clostridiales bacterium]|nr:MAG: hypothetical protein DBY04_01960 [Clostridiales bacterium]
MVFSSTDGRLCAKPDGTNSTPRCVRIEFLIFQGTLSPGNLFYFITNLSAKQGLFETFSFFS